MLEVDYRCRVCSKEFKTTYEGRDGFLNDSPRCTCGSAKVSRFIPTGLAAPMFNVEKFHAESQYPRVSRTLPLNMPGCPVVEKGSALHRQGYMPGSTIVKDRSHERNIMAGAYNGDRYSRD